MNRLSERMCQSAWPLSLSLPTQLSTKITCCGVLSKNPCIGRMSSPVEAQICSGAWRRISSRTKFASLGKSSSGARNGPLISNIRQTSISPILQSMIFTPNCLEGCIVTEFRFRDKQNQRQSNPETRIYYVWFLQIRKKLDLLAMHCHECINSPQRERLRMRDVQ